MPTFQQKAQQYFDICPYGYFPDRQSEFVGRWLGAEELARAVDWVQLQAHLRFTWEVDTDQDSSHFSDELPPYAVWSCSLVSVITGHTHTALAGIDLGRDGAPQDTDALDTVRAIQAQLALEVWQQEARS